MTNEEIQTQELTEQLRANIQSQMLKKVAVWVITGSIGVFALAALGAWTLLKGQIISDLGIVSEGRIMTLIQESRASSNLSDFPSGAVVAFDGGSYEKTSPERLKSGCPDGWVRFVQAEGRFILGSDAYPSIGETGKFKLRIEGGSPDYILTPENLPAHEHIAKVSTDGAHSHKDNEGNTLKGVTRSQSGTPWVGATSDREWVSNESTISEANSAHTHNVEISSPDQTSISIPIMPPYIPLYYCKKDG